MKRPETAAALLLSTIALAAPAFAGAEDGVQDQYSPASNAWFHCVEPINVWQQQVRVGIAGTLDAFEVVILGPVGAEIDLRLRVGDGWNVSPVVWSTNYIKATPDQEIVVFDTSAAGLVFACGDTFVIEAQGNDTDADLRGSYMHPEVGAPNYPEPLYLSEPGCYDNCGWSIGFRTWMKPLHAPLEHSRVGVPPNAEALMPGVTSGPVLGALWDPVIDHSSFLADATSDWLLVSAGSVNLPTAFGTLLADVSGGPLLYRTEAGSPFGVPVPEHCALEGLELTAQGASSNGATLLLTNALDVTIGTN